MTRALPIRPTRTTRTARTRATGVLIGSAAILAAALSGCSGGSSSSVTQTPGVSTTASSKQSGSSTTIADHATAASEYVRLVAPVDVARTAFRASTTRTEAELRAGPFASALQTWSIELGSFAWPTSAQSDVRTLIADIPPLVTDLRGVAAGDFADVSKAETDGSPVTVEAEQVRHDLGLPETG